MRSQPKDIATVAGLPGSLFLQETKMTISMHSASAPIFVRQLSAMLVWLDKAEAYSHERNFQTSAYLQKRLADDMLPFVNQIQIACDMAKGAMARLADVPVPAWEDNEASLDDLRVRIRRTIAYVQSFAAEAIDGSAQRNVSVPRRNKDALVMSGEQYLKHFVLPNFFFHCTTTYALLRHNGVPVGKMDFLGVV
jgi:hypothetical protein